MNSQITKITSKNDMHNLLGGSENALHRLDEDKRDSFKANFLELWNNQYLIQQAVPTELLDFAIQITNLGLSINPYQKQVYILPFAEKGRDDKKLEAVFRKEAIEQLVSDKGFFIECDNIWSIDGNETLESELSLAQQARLNKTDSDFVDNCFLGFYFTLSFMGEQSVPKQHCVVGVDYLKTVTKQLQSQEHKIKNWSHKAYRSAFGQFNLSAGRKTDMEMKLAQLEALAFSEPIEAEVTQSSQAQPQNALSLGNQEVQQKEATVADLNKFYKDSKNKNAVMTEMRKHKNWRSLDGKSLFKLLEKLKAI